MDRMNFLLLGLGLLASFGCKPESGPDQNDLGRRTIRVVATTGMVADAVRHVGKDRVSVTGLMGPGVDPHLYKASEGDVTRMADADVIFYNGLHLEGKMGEVFGRMQERGIHTAAVAQAIDPSRLLSPPEFKGAHDPHIWFDVRLWMKTVETVRDRLVQLDPAHGDSFRENAATYLEELENLNRYVKEQADTIPPAKRVLITAHDAFNYFGRAYGFEVRGLQGISTATEAGTADVQALSRFILERRIPAVFVESSVPRRRIEAVQAAVRAKGFEVRLGGELFSDAMGAPGTPEGSYIGMIRHNIDTITRALTGAMEEE